MLLKLAGYQSNFIIVNPSPTHRRYSCTQAESRTKRTESPRVQGRRVCPTSTASHVSRSLSFLGQQLEAAFVIASVRMQWHCVFPSPLISCWTLLVKAKDPSIRGAGCMPQTREGKKSLSSYPGSRATQHLSHPTDTAGAFPSLSRFGSTKKSRKLPHADQAW